MSTDPAERRQFEPLSDRLKPVDDAMERLRARSANDPDLLAALDGLLAVVRQLAQQRWVT